MAYEPLHHKYRPQIFAHLVGQEAIATTLTNAILSERIAPAYLFTGPRGTGKTSSARILAKSLNCKQEAKPTPSPCGICEVCRMIAIGTALDVIEIDAASNTGVDNIRDIIERSQFAPVQCRYKVYVIDECHMLSTAAFNSLLKTLEEPPDRVVFVLATTDPQRVLPTIISRCQRFDFRRIPLEAMVHHLQDIATKENIKITQEALTLVAQVAQGGLRDAESLLDQLSLLPQEVSPEAVWDLVGAVPERDLLALSKAIASDNSETVLEQCRRLMDRGREPLVVLQNLAGFYRDLLIAKTAPSRSDLVAVTAPTWKQLCDFACQLEVSQILHGQQHLKSSEAQIKNTTQPRLWLEVTLLGLLPSALSTNIVSYSQASPVTEARNNTASSNVIELKSVAKQPPQTRKESTQQPQQPQQPQASATPTPEASGGVTANQSQLPSPVEPDSRQHPTTNSADLAAENTVEPLSQSLEQVWQEVLANVKMRSTQALLRQHGQLIGYEEAVATISIPTNSLLKMVQRGLSDIEAAFQKVFNQKVKVNFHVGTGGISVNQSTVIPPTSESRLIDQTPKPGLKDTMANNPASELNHQASLNSESPSIGLPSTPPLASWVADEVESKQQDLEKTFNRPTVPIQPQMAGNRELTSSFAIGSSRTSWTQDLDWPNEEIDSALESLKNFFEGEIVEIKETFNLSLQPINFGEQKSPKVDNTALSQKVVEIVSDQFEPESKDSEALRQAEISPLLDFCSSELPQEQESEQITPTENGNKLPRREDWPLDDNGEPAF
jgi:DNA polymerase-3 subunit gamma/tau